MAEHAQTSISLPAIADIDALGGLRDELVKAGAGGLRIEAGGVERVGTNTLLLLLAAGKAASLAGLPFHIVAPSPAFRLAVERLGLDGAFAPLVGD